MDDSQKGYYISMNEVMSTLWLGWARSAKEIAATKYCSELSQENYNILSTEYYTFYFHCLDRMLSFNQGISQATQDIMMQKAKGIAIYGFEGEDEKVLKMEDNPLRLNSGIGGKLEFLSKYSLAVNFSEICEIRCAEYAKYKYLFYYEEEKESMGNNAHGTFCNKIAPLIKDDPEEPFGFRLSRSIVLRVGLLPEKRGCQTESKND